MAEVPLPFELCLKNLSGEDVSVQIDPGETFQRFIEKTEAVLGYVLDVNSITNGDIIDLEDDMYNYFLKIEQQITQLPLEQRDNTGNIVFEESEMVAEEPETIYVWEDGTPIDPSLITFENGMAILKVPDAVESVEGVNEELPLKEENLDDDPEDAPLQISEAAEEPVVREPPELSVKPSTLIKQYEPKAHTKPPVKNSRMEISADFNSDEGEVEMLDEELLLRYERPPKASARHREYPPKGRTVRKKYVKNRDDDRDYDPSADEVRSKMKDGNSYVHKMGRHLEKINQLKLKQGKYMKTEPDTVNLRVEKDIDEEIELQVEKAIDDEIISKEDVEIKSQDDDGLVEGSEKSNPNLNYKLVPSRNSDFAAQFSFFLGEQLKADPTVVAKEVAKSSVKIKSIQRTKSDADSKVSKPSMSMLANQSFPPSLEDEPVPKSKFRVKETTESASSDTPKITQFKIVAPFSLKSRYGSPPLESPKKVSPPRCNPPISKSPTPSWRAIRSPPPSYSPPRPSSPYTTPRSTWENQRPLWESVKKPMPIRLHSPITSPAKPNRLLDTASEDDIDDLDFCHFCVKLLMSESEKAFILKNKNEDFPFDKANRKISKVLCEGCLNRGYIEVQTYSKLLGPDEMYIVKDNDYFVYKKKSAVVKRKREGIVYSAPKIPKLEFDVKTEKDTLKAEDDLKSEVDLDFDDLLVERKGKSVILTFNTESVLDKKLDRIALSDSDDEEFVSRKPVVRKKKVDIKTETLKQTQTDFRKTAGGPKSGKKFKNEVFLVGDDKDYMHQFTIVDINKITGGKIKSGFKPSPTSNKSTAVSATGAKKTPTPKSASRLIPAPQPIVKLTKLDDPVVILTSKRAHKVNRRYGNYFSKLHNYVSRSTPKIKMPSSANTKKNTRDSRSGTPISERSITTPKKNKKGTSSRSLSSRSTSPEQYISSPKTLKGVYASKASSSITTSPERSISGAKIKKSTPVSKALSTRSPAIEKLIQSAKMKNSKPVSKTVREDSWRKKDKLTSNTLLSPKASKKLSEKLNRSSGKMKKTVQETDDEPTVERRLTLKGTQIEEMLKTKKEKKVSTTHSKETSDLDDSFNLVLENETEDDVSHSSTTEHDEQNATSRVAKVLKSDSGVVDNEPFSEKSVNDLSPKINDTGATLEYSCRFCNRKMQYITLVVSHSIRHQNINEKEFPCIICPETFQDYRTVSKHMKTKHPVPVLVPDVDSTNAGKSSKEQSESKLSPEKQKSDNETLNAQDKSVQEAEDQVYSDNDDDDDVTKTLKSIFGMGEDSLLVKKEAVPETVTVEANVTTETRDTDAVESVRPKSEPKVENIKVLRTGPPNNAEKELVKALLTAYDVMDLDEEILEQLKANLLKTIRLSSGDDQTSETESQSANPTFNCLQCRETYKSKSELKTHNCKKAISQPKAKYQHTRIKPFSRNKERTIHQCPKCGEIRETLPRLKFHLRFHEPPYLYQDPVAYSCRLCSELFKDEHFLYTHMAYVHFEDVRAHFSLEKSCNRMGGIYVGQQHRGIDSFSRRARRERRKLILPPRCQVCFQRMPRSLIRAHLTRHALTFHDGSVYYCIVCQESFDSVTQAEKHSSLKPGCMALKDKLGTSLNSKTHDNEDIVAQDLRQLRVLFEKLPKKAREVIRVKTLKKAYKCEYCDRTFVNKVALRDHWSIHAKAALPFVCLSCNANFASQGRLFSHVITECTQRTTYATIQPVVFGKHQPLDAKFPVVRLYLCTDCDATFLHWAYVKAHKKISHSKHTFKCDDCTKEFRSSWSVNWHKKIDHKKIYETKLYKCTECQFTTKVENSLNEHKQTVHAGFKCSLCGTKFATKRWMEFHEKSHENQQLYRCAKCPKAFRHSNLLREHFNAEHAETKVKKPQQLKAYTVHKCPECPERFLYEKDLKLHTKIHEMEINITFPIRKPTVVPKTPSKSILEPVAKMHKPQANPSPNLSAHPLMSPMARTAITTPKHREHLLTKKYDPTVKPINPLMTPGSVARSAVTAPKSEDQVIIRKYNPTTRPDSMTSANAASRKTIVTTPKPQNQPNAAIVKKYESTSKLIVREMSERLKMPQSQSQRRNVPVNVMSDTSAKTDSRDEFDMTEFFKKMQPKATERQPAHVKKIANSISKVDTIGKPNPSTHRSGYNSNLLQTLANSPKIHSQSRIETMDQLFGQINKTIFNTRDGPQIETKKIPGKGRGFKPTAPRKSAPEYKPAVERKGKGRKGPSADSGKVMGPPGQIVHAGISKSMNIGNVFHMVESQRNDEALTISMEVNQPLQFTDGTVGESIDTTIGKSMDIGDVLNLLEGEAVVGDLTVPQAVDIRESSLSGSLPIVIDESGALNVVLDSEDLQQSNPMEIEAVVNPEENALESEEGIETTSGSYLMQYTSQEGESQDEAGLSVEQSNDDNNIMIVDEDGHPIMNDEMQAQSGNIVVTTSGHIIIQGQVFKLDMKEGTTLDLEKISIRQDEDGQIFLETIEPDPDVEENPESQEPPIL